MSIYYRPVHHQTSEQIFGIITGVTFGAAARLSYDWFATGSPATTM